jgi:hypothetical protein
MDEIGGNVPATFRETAGMETLATRRMLARRRVPSWCSALVGVLADGVRDDSLERLFASSRSAQFAALPPRQKSRLLDRGLRPPQ